MRTLKTKWKGKREIDYKEEPRVYYMGIYKLQSKLNYK